MLMSKKLRIYINNFAIVLTYAAVIAGIVFIIVSTVLFWFCLETILVGAVGIFAGACLLWSARLLIDLFGLLPNQD